MFADAIEKVGDYTRPLIYIFRNYGETVVSSGSATMFFVNEDGCAVTCRRVAETILASHKANAKYFEFKKEKSLIVNDKKRAEAIKRLEKEFEYKKGVTVNMKCNFMGCVYPVTEITCHVHKKHDLAIVQFKGYENRMYHSHAVFADSADSVRPGDMLCRIGFPFPEIANTIYNGIADDIEWGDPGGISAPRFPLDGMVTRHIARNGEVCGIELSTPGLKGQCGGPLFDRNGVVYGMQCETRRFNLGYRFDKSGSPVNSANAEGEQAFLNLGHCVSAEVIKSFLKENGVKYYTESGVVE